MRRWLLFAAILLTACGGCGVMEDCFYGPDPCLSEQAYQPPPPSTCNAPPPIRSTSQTQEPPLSQTSR